MNTSQEVSLHLLSRTLFYCKSCTFSGEKTLIHLILSANILTFKNSALKQTNWALHSSAPVFFFLFPYTQDFIKTQRSRNVQYFMCPFRLYRSQPIKNWTYKEVENLSIYEMGNAQSNESVAVKRQAEGFSNPIYRLLDLGVSLFCWGLSVILMFCHLECFYFIFDNLFDICHWSCFECLSSSCHICGSLLSCVYHNC